MNMKSLWPGIIIVLLTSFIPFNEPKGHLYNIAALATKYRNDVGIENDPDVLYVEKFNDGMKNILSRYTDVVNAEGMSLDSLDLPEGSIGAKAMKMTNIGAKNDGGHLYKHFKTGFDGTVYLRYYVKYPSDSKGFIHHEGVWFGGYNPGTSWPNPRAGICGLGDKRISIAYEPVNAPKMDTYLYWGDMKSSAGGKCWGNDMINGSPTAKTLTWDKWMCVELMIKLNNPVEAHNGELRIWQDGVEVGHWGPGFPKGYWDADSWFNSPSHPVFQGFRWRTNAKLNLNYIWIEFYDDTTRPDESHHIKFANLVMARKYIGPISK